MSPAWILLVLLAADDPAMPEVAPFELCSPASGSRSPLLVLDGSGLREGAEGALFHASSPDAPPVSLACSPGRAYLGLREGRAGRILRFERGESGWTEEEVGARTRGAPVAILPVGEGIAVLYERRGQFAFALPDSVSLARPSERPLPSRPSGMGLSPQGDRVFVAVGAEVRTFSAETGATSVAYLFPEPIDALATHPGVPRLLAGLGARVLATDPADPATRGALPIREESAVEGRILDLAWTGRGEVAAVLTGDPAGISFLSGEDLSLLERRDLPRSGRAMVALGLGEVSVMLENGEILRLALGAENLSRARPPKDEPLPEPETALVPELQPTSSVEVDPEPAAGPELEPALEPASAPRPDSPPPPPSTPVPVAVPVLIQEEPPSPEPEAPAQTVAEDPPTEEEPVTAGEETRAEPRPGTASEEPTTPAPEDLPGGTIAGRVTGQDQLAEVVVLLGPNNVMREAGRYPLQSKGGERSFLVKDLPPGRYRVMLMGPDASSLATRPRFATVTISGESGDRADFEVVRGL